MYRSRERDVTFKFEDHGPGYLVRGGAGDVGIVVLRPGDDYPNHYHAHSENSFFVLEGEAVLWSECRDRFPMEPGDFHRCDPGEMHYLVNDGDVLWRALFVRTPHDPSDTIIVDWRPGEPVPDRGLTSP
jgi:quercetin dioxygenase-like cupin family protein